MQKNSKSKNIIINIICIFSVIALIVAMASIFGHITKSSVSLLPPKSDNSEEPEQPTPEEPEDPVEPEVDPSLTLINFDGVTFKNNPGSIAHTSDVGAVHLKAGVFDTDGTSLYFGITPDTYESILEQGKTTIDPYALIGPTIGVKDNYAIVYDLDVSIDDGYVGEFGIRPHYRNPENQLANVDGCLLRYKSNVFYVVGNTEPLVTDIPNEFHYTYILWYDGSADIYLNGQRIYHLDAAYKPTCVNASGLRFSLVYSFDVENEVGVTFDNIKIKTFDLGYKGAINDLYIDPTVDLHTNADTVLGGGY